MRNTTDNGRGCNECSRAGEILADATCVRCSLGEIFKPFRPHRAHTNPRPTIPIGLTERDANAIEARLRRMSRGGRRADQTLANRIAAA